MKKTLTYLAACTLPIISSLRADEEVGELEKSQQDRERLMALVVKLEDDFGKTLKDYHQLQKDYEVLQNDQSAEKTQALLKSDLKALRKELHIERGFAIKAEAEFARLAELEKENKVLVAALKKEKSAQERSSLEAAALKKNHLLQITQFEEAIAKYRKEEVAQKSAEASLAKLQGEQDSMSNLLKTREQDLQNLRTDLAAEMKRALEIPLLQTQQTQLTNQLAESHEKAEGLSQKNEALSAKKAELEEEVAKTKQSIVKMQTELDENVKELLKVKADLVQNQESLATTKRGLADSVAQAEQVTQEKDELVTKQQAAEEELLQVKAGLAQSQESLVTAKQGLADSMAQAEQAAQEREELVTRQQATEDELLQVKESLATAKQDLADSMAQAEQVAQEKEEFVTKQQTTEAELVAAQTELAEVKEAISKQEAVAVESETLNERVEELTVEKEALLAELEKEKLASAEVTKNLEVAQAELVKNEEIGLKFTESQTANEQLTANLFETQNLLKAAQAVEEDLEVAQKKEATLMTELATLKKAKGALSEQMTQRDQDLKKEQAARVKEVKALQDEKTKLTGNIAKLTADLKQTRKELGELQLTASATEKELDAMRRASVQVAPVLYAKGEADVSTQQARVLEQVQKVLEFFPDAHFDIIGHTCDLGSPESNLRLSEQRAQALSDYLVEKGISQDVLKSRGVGHTEPKVENTSEANRRQNRRVVVKILD